MAITGVEDKQQGQPLSRDKKKNKSQTAAIG